MKILKLVLLWAVFATKTVSASSQELDLHQSDAEPSTTQAQRFTPAFDLIIGKDPDVAFNNMLSFLSIQDIKAHFSKEKLLDTFSIRALEIKDLLERSELLQPFNLLLNHQDLSLALCNLVRRPHVSFTEDVFIRFFDEAPNENSPETSKERKELFSLLYLNAIDEEQNGTGSSAIVELIEFRKAIAKREKRGDDDLWLWGLLLDAHMNHTQSTDFARKSGFMFISSAARIIKQLGKFHPEARLLIRTEATDAAAELLQTKTTIGSTSSIYEKVAAIVILKKFGEIYHPEVGALTQLIGNEKNRFVSAVEYFHEFMSHNNADLNWDVELTFDDKRFAMRTFIEFYQYHKGLQSSIIKALKLLELEILAQNEKFKEKLKIELKGKFQGFFADSKEDIYDFLFGNAMLSMLDNGQKASSLNSILKIAEDNNQNPYNRIRAISWLHYMYYVHNLDTQVKYARSRSILETIAQNTQLQNMELRLEACEIFDCVIEIMKDENDKIALKMDWNLFKTSLYQGDNLEQYTYEQHQRYLRNLRAAPRPKIVKQYIHETNQRRLRKLLAAPNIEANTTS